MTTLATTIPSAASADAERFQTAGVITVTGGHAVNDTYTSFLPPLLPSLIQSFGLSNTQAGLLSVFLQWPSVLQPFIGYLADRTNLRYLVILAPALTGMAMSLLGVAPQLRLAGHPAAHRRAQLGGHAIRSDRSSRADCPAASSAAGWVTGWWAGAWGIPSAP